MGWTDAFKYGSKIIDKHQAKEDASVDAGLPLRARIGGLINIQQAPFVRAMINGSLLEIKEQKNMLLTAIGRVKMSFSGKLYRYYTVKGDVDTEKETFVQLFQNEQGAIAELMYCRALTRIIPESLEDQKAFTGEDGYGLGEKTYCLWREQLAELGYSEAALSAAFGESDHIEYHRDAGDSACDFVAPFTGTETRVDDTAGEHGLSQTMVYMPYVRDIGGMKEYLLITTEIVNSTDGDPGKRQIHVDLMLGLPIEESNITIQ